MTSRERLLTALHGGTPDRVPVTLFLIEQGHFLGQLYPDMDPQDSEACQLKVIEVQKQFGCDVYVRLLNDIIDINIIYGGLDVSRSTANWEVKTEEVREGNNLRRRSVVNTPKGRLEQEFTTSDMGHGTFHHACTKKPIKTPADLEIAEAFEPGITDDYKERIRKRIGVIKQALGDSGIIGTWGPHGPFNVSSLLIKHEELYSLFLTEPEFYERLMNFSLKRSYAYIRALDDAGTDVHCVGGNVPGGFLGKKTYDEYILPYEKKLIAVAQEKGKAAMYHNCGEIMNLVESYIALGVKCVEPFSPPPLGDVADLAKAKALSRGAYSMLSGVDQVNILQKGTTEQVEQKTEAAMKAGKPGGGFIMQSVDFLEYGTPEKNVETYVKTALEHAAY